MNLIPLWDRYASALDTEIKSLIQEQEFPFYDLMEYHLGWRDARNQPAAFSGGKRLRPTLCLLACEAVGGEWEQALPAATAIELIHNFSLIHDDIEDQSPQRRGRPALWKVAGLAQALNAGDGMHVLARLAVYGLAERGVAPQLILQVSRLLDQTCLNLCEGQYLDLSYESRAEVSVADYLLMAERKTASLIGASLTTGALIGGTSAATAAALGGIGMALGLAFQIRDDILGLWGDSQSTGKAPGEDILQKKKSLPLVYALGQSGPRAAELRRICAKKRIAPDDVPQVMGLLEELGARQWAQTQVEEHYRRALAQMEGIDLTLSGRRDLEAVAALLVEREG